MKQKLNEESILDVDLFVFKESSLFLFSKNLGIDFKRVFNVSLSYKECLYFFVFVVVVVVVVSSI